jgi:acetylornithine deacetylase/succinyl-diaminopimelate desuccinylase-like protein
MDAGAAARLVDEYLDEARLVATLQELARVPTDVPLGHDTLIDPDDPKLVYYVQEVLRPRLETLPGVGLFDARLNNLIAVAGNGSRVRSLLIQNYTPAQHNNLMAEPFSGRIASGAAYGRDEPAVFGRGVSQNKAHQAVMLAVLELLGAAGVELEGRLYWAVNNEGRSSHACSDAILDALPELPEFGIIQIGTGLRLSLGNRGRVDIIAHVTGRASHSSEPEKGHNAIEGASKVIQRLKALTWPDEHELLGGRHAVVYKVRYAPLAPHTLPSEAWLTIDRRLLPGDDLEQAADEARVVIGDLAPFEVSVRTDVTMLPALVDPDLAWVGALERAHRAERRQDPERVWGRGSFDAGGPCARGVPTVMYGASGGDGLLGDDFVAIADVVSEARVLARLILEELA